MLNFSIINAHKNMTNILTLDTIEQILDEHFYDV